MGIGLHVDVSEHADAELWIEIEEFLRVGVMLMRDDLSNVKNRHESE